MGTSKCTQKKKAVPACASSHSSILMASSPAPATTAVSHCSSQSTISSFLLPAVTPTPSLGKHPHGSSPGQQGDDKGSQSDGGTPSHTKKIHIGTIVDKASHFTEGFTEGTTNKEILKLQMAGWSFLCFKHYFMPPSINDANPAIVQYKFICKRC
ncbi:hypothetical protein BDP27DRAFT_1425352 [Rhodocollybia butyracea]|uniref:Uncharacterized protein n=1 Tax=Rhodocollybia butyracea TaxID=206335 RepID=A0A9P5PLR8_9AGAR|nr:hypothetical protein BDP27DRAFT_1425352 [Rhodocollybia butyracea]